MTFSNQHQPSGVSGGLRDNFNRMMAMAHAGALSESAMGSFERLIKMQITAAERVAQNTPAGSPVFESARQVMGYPDEPAQILAFPKPKPVLPTLVFDREACAHE